LSATMQTLQQTADSPTSELDECKLYTFQSHQIEWVWNRVTPILSRVPLDPGMTLDRVKQDLEAGDSQLWTIWRGEQIEAAWTTRIQTDPDGSIYCLAWMCAGDNVSDWIHLSQAMEDWARDLGCKDVRVVGRPGWKKFGYRPLYTVLSKPLGESNELRH
jgi:hypothetical protein